MGFNLSDSRELQKAKETGAFRTKCPKYIRDAMEIAKQFVR